MSFRFACSQSLESRDKSMLEENTQEEIDNRKHKECLDNGQLSTLDGEDLSEMEHLEKSVSYSFPCAPQSPTRGRCTSQ